MNVDYSALNHLWEQYKNVVQKQNWTRSFFEDLKNDITYHSNKIEGLTLTYGETIRFLKYGLIDSTEESKIKEITDLQNHRRILDLFFESYNQHEISAISIKKIHKELMENPHEKIMDVYRKPGEYKGEINGTIRQSDGKTYFHEYMDPISVPGAMGLLISKINQKLKKIDFQSVDFHPVTIAAEFHYQFSNVIHPFYDGNGRLARLYSNLILMKSDFPAIVIKGEAEDRERYIQSLILCENEKSLIPLIKIIEEQLIDTMNTGIERSAYER